jgi:hypothetical protein
MFTASTSGGNYPTARSGSYKLKLEINSGVVGNTAFASQTLPSSQQPVPVMGNQQWTFSGYMLNFANTAMPENSYALLEIVFKGNFGEKSFTSEHLTPQVHSTSDVWDYTSLTATAPAGSSEVSFYVRLIQGSEDPSGSVWGSVWFDDMNATVVEPVPELASSGWIAVLVIGLAVGGRRGWRSLRKRSSS